jgi:ferritin
MSTNRSILDILRNVKAAEEQTLSEVETPAPGEAGQDTDEGMPLSAHMKTLLDEQYTAEAASSELYYGLAAYFFDSKLSGFGAYFMKQAEEERAHAMKFFQYLLDCNVLIKMGQIEGPKTSYESIVAAVKEYVLHERKVTRLCYAIAEKAIEEKDYFTHQFIQWFLKEQLEEVRSAEDLSKRLDFVKDDRAGILCLDKALG